MDALKYRNIMRQQAGAVALICTGEVGARYGLTATAVCSLTDDPPTILVCVNRTASAHDFIKSSGRFSVNLLGVEHEEIAGVFAGQTALKGEDRFTVEGYEWQEYASGMPCLKGALGSLDCRVSEDQEFSSHTVFFGIVDDGQFSDAREPLLYFRGDFGQLVST